MWFFLACVGGEVDSPDKTPSDDPADGASVWTSEGLCYDVDGAYDLGLAQTGAQDGWAGEDCLGEIPDGYDYMSDGGYQICHRIEGQGCLTPVATPDELSEDTTLLSQVDEPTITYVLFEAESAACWMWGDDVTYYDALGCTIL